MIRSWRATRRAQVLVFPYVRPRTVAAVMVAVLALAGVLMMRPHHHRHHHRRHNEDPLTPRLPLPLGKSANHGPEHTAPLTGMFVRPGVFVAPCGGALEATVLASTLRLGAGGADVPISVGFALSGEPLGVSSLGSGLAPGSRRALAVGPGRRVAFVTAPRLDFLGAAAPTQVRSDSPGGFADAPFVPRCVMALDGDRVPHANRPGFDGQPSLAQILSPYTNRDGRLALGPNRAILAYEYSSHFHSPAADFQDMVLLVQFHPAE